MFKIFAPDGYPKKRPFFLLTAVILAISGYTFWLHAPRAHAQEPRERGTVSVSVPDQAPSPAESETTVVTMPAALPADPAEKKREEKLDEIGHLIDQKQQFLDTTEARIADWLQILTQYQNNKGALTETVNNDGLHDLDRNIHRTRPLIRNLKSQMAAARYNIALLAIQADTLDRRIIQLKLQLVRELQPDPSHLIALQKQLETGVNKILCGIDTTDPYATRELGRAADLRSQLEPRIEDEKADLMNLAARQGVAAADCEQREHERALRQESPDLVLQLRDNLLNSPTWRGETD